MKATLLSLRSPKRRAGKRPLRRDDGNLRIRDGMGVSETNRIDLGIKFVCMLSNETIPTSSPKPPRLELESFMPPVIRLLFTCLLCCLALLSAGTAQAQRRVAFVVGNEAYTGRDLPRLNNPAIDADPYDLETLRQQSFSLDGRRVITGSTDGKARVWDLP